MSRLLAFLLVLLAGAAFAVAEQPYTHFLCCRHNTVNGTAETDTLVLGTVTPEGVQLRDLYTLNNLHIGLRFLGLYAGKVYLLHLGNLLYVDVATGACTRIAEGCDKPAVLGERLFVVREGGLLEYHLGMQAWRKLAVTADWPWDARVMISPDGMRLAWYGPATEKTFQTAQLMVLQLEDGAVRKVGTPIRYVPSLLSSFIESGGPLAWADANILLTVRTETPNAAPGDGLVLSDMTNYLVAIDVTTGAQRDIAPLPGEKFGARLTFDPSWRAGTPLLLVNAGTTSGKRLAIDLPAKKLNEDDTVGPDLHLRITADHRQELLHGTQSLATVNGNLAVALAPDQRQVLWLTDRQPQQVMWYELATKTARTVATGWFDPNLAWCTADELVATPPPPPPAGWTAFTHTPYPVPRPPDTRAEVTTALRFTLTSAQPRYHLHEPIILTLTLTNVGNRALTVARPRIDHRVCGMTLNYPGGSKLLDRFWGSEQLNPLEQIALKPGQTLTVNETLEVGLAGKYTLHSEYRLNGVTPPAGQEFRGRLAAAPCTFEVVNAPEAGERLAAKITRLLATLREQQAKEPAWNGWLPAQDDLAEIGTAATPHLLALMQETKDPAILQRYCWVANRLADPRLLPAYQQAATGKDAELRRLAINGLAGLIQQRTPVRQEAINILLALLARALPGAVRESAVNVLMTVKDEAIKTAFEQHALGDDPLVGPRAARYLAVWENLSLADWLALAEQHPTAARLQAARAIIDDLRRTWHLQEPPALDNLTWQQATTTDGRARYQRTLHAWATWAREHPQTSTAYFEQDRRWWK